MEFQHTHMGFRVGGEIQPVHINTTDLFWRRRDFCKRTWFSPVLRHTEVPILKHLSTEYKANAFQSWIKSSIWMKSIWRKKGKKKNNKTSCLLSQTPKVTHILSALPYIVFLSLQTSPPLFPFWTPAQFSSQVMPPFQTHSPTFAKSPTAPPHLHTRKKLFEPTKPEAPASLNSLNSTRL